jgi:hypothetical protein
MSTRSNARKYAIKYKLITQLGGKCIRCGYNNLIHLSVFDFHHRDPKQKLFGINNSINSGRSHDELLVEIAKCDLLCRNCHAIIHDEMKHLNLNIGEEYLKYINSKHVKVLENKEGVPSKEELIELIKINNKSDISKIYNVAHCTVSYWLEKFGLKYCEYKTAKIKPSKDELADLIKIKSAREIAIQFNVSDRAVKKWLDKFGLKNPLGKIFYKPTKIDWAFSSSGRALPLQG